MKASERKKNKFKAIKERLEMIRLHKNQIRFFLSIKERKRNVGKIQF